MQDGQESVAEPDCPLSYLEPMVKIEEDEDNDAQGNHVELSEQRRVSYNMAAKPLTVERTPCPNAVLTLIASGDTSALIQWMKSKNLLKSEMKCDVCQENMNWNKRTEVNDKFQWRCRNKLCAKYNSKVSIRKNSFFSKSHLDLRKWIHLIYLWSIGASAKHCCKETNISPRVMVDVQSFFREVCAKHFSMFPIKLGGPDVVVEIDESCFSHKIKGSRGKGPLEAIWVFGIVEKTTGSRKPAGGYMEIVKRRDVATLLPIIQRIVRPGSIIHSDQWKAYKDFQDAGFSPVPVNHSVHFVQRETDVRVETIESYTTLQKYKIRKMKGCARHLLNSYLQEMMWRDRYGGDAFNKLCEHIAIQF